ncbi:hypothetical protein PENNAL_c0409G06217 [Penicillium nalgiovense]|uniref:Ketoreductase (KR) domain-containing protein n=1 Tax=Penicillium nalgiovense TaxID=60175 RepID=A0A1V6W1E8_PENNA|nr:hypothetical protein PENNAL_c0409G06217 [Penicillium nalgiovense]
MRHNFDKETHGAEITHLFPERVQDKTCISPHLHITLQLTFPVILAGLKRGELAAATADALAAAGAGVIICTGHCQTELQPVIDHINRKYKKVKVVFVTADTSSLTSFQEAGRAIKRMGIPINGVRTDVRAPTWVDVGFSDGKDYHCLDGYSQSSLANILFAKSLSNMYRNRPIAAFSANPGNIKNDIQTYVTMEQINEWLDRKKIAGEEIPMFLQQAPKSLAQGSATVLRGLLDPDLEYEPGAFLSDCQAHKLPHLDFPAGEKSATALWRRSEELLEAFLC